MSDIQDLTFSARDDSSFHVGNSVHVKDDTLGHPTDYEWSNICVLAVLVFLQRSELWSVVFGLKNGANDILGGVKQQNCDCFGDCLNKPNETNLFNTCNVKT